MDTARYVVATLVWIVLPPAVVYWFMLHPFIDFWRRRGKTLTFSLLTIVFVGGMVALYLTRDITNEKRELTEGEKADVAASFQEAAIDVLIQKTKRAAQEYGVRSILLSGGVSANTLLRERMRLMAHELTITYAQPDLKWTGDNAAMIAIAGYYSKEKATSWEDVAMNANLRLGDK